MVERLSREQVLDLLFEEDFELSDGDNSDDDLAGGTAYLGNNELHQEELNLLAQSVVSCDSSPNGREESDDSEEEDSIMSTTCPQNNDEGKSKSDRVFMPRKLISERHFAVVIFSS